MHHLVSRRRLGGAIGIWGAIPNHNGYINELLYAYGQRVGFMKQLDCDTIWFLSRQGLSWGQTGGSDGDGLWLRVTGTTSMCRGSAASV